MEKSKFQNPNSKNNVYVILGPSGCGKGTQGKLLAEYLGVPFISMGDIFREEYEAKTPEGLEAFKWWGKGIWVPDELAFKLLKKKLDKVESGFVLDSFPRVSSQVLVLDKYLEGRGQKIDRVLNLVTSDKEAVWRIQRRVSEDRKRGKVREDETEPAIKKRLSEYKEKVKPLLDIYRESGILIDVDNEPRNVEAIHRSILSRIPSFTVTDSL